VDASPPFFSCFLCCFLFTVLLFCRCTFSRIFLLVVFLDSFLILSHDFHEALFLITRTYLTRVQYIQNVLEYGMEKQSSRNLYSLVHFPLSPLTELFPNTLFCILLLPLLLLLFLFLCSDQYIQQMYFDTFGGLTDISCPLVLKAEYVWQQTSGTVGASRKRRKKGVQPLNMTGI